MEAWEGGAVPGGPGCPGTPGGPWSPCGPRMPGSPAGPRGPARDPAGPAGPAGPTAPVGPGGPRSPCEPLHAARRSSDNTETNTTVTACGPRRVSIAFTSPPMRLSERVYGRHRTSSRRFRSSVSVVSCAVENREEPRAGGALLYFSLAVGLVLLDHQRRYRDFAAVPGCRHGVDAGGQFEVKCAVDEAVAIGLGYAYPCLEGRQE